jgi:hypothetical protein
MNHLTLTPEQALADVKAVRRDRADSHWLECAIVLADLHATDMLCIDDMHKRTAERSKRYMWLERENKDLMTENAKLRAELDNQKPWKDYIDQHQEILNTCLQLKTALAGAAEERDQLRAELDAYKAIEKRTIEESQKLRAELANAKDHVTRLRSELAAIKSAPAATEPPALSRFLPVRPDDVPAPPDGYAFGLQAGPLRVPLACDVNYLALFAGSQWQIGARGACGAPYAIRWTAPADIWHRFGLLAPSEGGGWIPHTPGDAMPCDCVCEVLLRGEIDDALFRLKPGEVRCGTQWCWDDDHADNDIIGWRPALAEVAT